MTIPLVTLMLEQQQLLEPAPVRRLIVPDGHTAWWGVDPSTLRIALARVTPQSDGQIDRAVSMQSFALVDGAARLSEIYAGTRRFVTSVATCCTWPGVVFVEQPGGSQRNWPLYYGVGVMMAGLFDALHDVTGRAVRIETVVPASWKRVACGRGDIYKPKKNDPRPYGVLAWAQHNGYAGTSWDEADALGIAECARRTITLEPR